MGVYVYLAIIVTLFTFVAIFFNGFDYTLSTSEPEFEALMNTSNDSISDYSLETRTNLRSIWQYWPFTMFLMMILWGIVVSQQQQQGVRR